MGVSEFERPLRSHDCHVCDGGVEGFLFPEAKLSETDSPEELERLLIEALGLDRGAGREKPDAPPCVGSVETRVSPRIGSSSSPDGGDRRATTSASGSDCLGARLEDGIRSPALKLPRR